MSIIPSVLIPHLSHTQTQIHTHTGHTDTLLYECFFSKWKPQHTQGLLWIYVVKDCKHGQKGKPIMPHSLCVYVCERRKLGEKRYICCITLTLLSLFSPHTHKHRPPISMCTSMRPHRHRNPVVSSCVITVAICQYAGTHTPTWLCECITQNTHTHTFSQEISHSADPLLTLSGQTLHDALDLHGYI